MKTIITEETTTKEELIEKLKFEEAIIGPSIFIEKFLREDKTINLELLEIALEYLSSVGSNIYIVNMGVYYMERGIIFNDSAMTEELNFLLNIMSNMIEELKPEGKEVKLFWQNEIQF